MEIEYPTILRRYFSSLIDGVMLFLIFIIFISSNDGNDQLSSIIKFLIPVIIIILYEPILTSKFCTLGQAITGIRVRRVDDLKKISILAAYFRYVVKIFLGFISFFSIIFSDKSRAIHDFTSGSVVIMHQNNN